MTDIVSRVRNNVLIEAKKHQRLARMYAFAVLNDGQALTSDSREHLRENAAYHYAEARQRLFTALDMAS